MSSSQAWVLHQAPKTPNHSSPAYRHALTLKAAPTFLKQQLYKVKPSGNQGVADQWAVHHFLINGSLLRCLSSMKSSLSTTFADFFF